MYCFIFLFDSVMIKSCIDPVYMYNIVISPIVLRPVGKCQWSSRTTLQLGLILYYSSQLGLLCHAGDWHRCECRPEVTVRVDVVRFVALEDLDIYFLGL